MLRTALAAFFVGLVGVPAFAADCATDLARTTADLQESLHILDGIATRAPQEICATYRDNVVILERAGEVFRRCMTGREAEELIATIDKQLADSQEIIRLTCARR